MNHNEDKIENFYGNPKELTESTLRREILVILDDFNTKIDCSRIDTWCTGYIGLYQLGGGIKTRENN